MAFGDYIVIVENAEGAELVRFTDSNEHWRPMQGEGYILSGGDVEDRPHLAAFVGRYVVRQVDCQSPPPTVRRNRYNQKIPFCYVRPERGRGLMPEPSNAPTPDLAVVPGAMDPIIALEIHGRSRRLGALIDNIADEAALNINEGAPLDQSLVDRLERARSIANEISVDAFVNAKLKSKSE